MADGPSPCQCVAVVAIGPTDLMFGETVVAAGKSGQWVAIEAEST